MKRKVRKKPEPEEEKEPMIVVKEKEKSVELEKMTPVDQERQGMSVNESSSPMTPLKA